MCDELCKHYAVVVDTLAHALCLQWEIYDAYMSEYEAKQREAALAKSKDSRSVSDIHMTPRTHS